MPTSNLHERYAVVFDYLERSLPDDPLYAWILAETAERGIPQIQITAEQGRTLRLLASLIGARRILEIGTLGGYSTVWLASALPADGRIITLEMQPKHAALAHEALDRAGLDGRAQVVVGPALASLEQLELDAPLDLVFIDADKPSNRAYFDWAVAHVRPGGLVLVDNVLLNGRVSTDQESAFYRDLRAFNDYVIARYGERVTVIPFFKDDEDNLDGLMVVHLP